MRARVLAIVAVLALIMVPALASAKKSGSFSSGGSRSGSSGWSSSSKPAPRPSSPSGSSSGWSGSSKPSQSAPAPSEPAPSAPSQRSGTGSSWSNSGGASTSQTSRSSGTSAFSSSGADAARKQAATSSYRGYQGLYGKQGNPVNPGQVSTSKPILNNSRTFNSYNDYSRYRDNYYSGRGWSAPGYAYGSYSSFGMWDAMFMWFMLSHLTSGSSFFYNHQNDPGVQSFRQEANKLAESNADLKKQVDDLNAKMDEMKKEGIKPDPTAMPADVDPTVALAEPPVVEQPRGNAASKLFWPIMGMVALGGAAYMFMRRRGA